MAFLSSILAPDKVKRLDALADRLDQKPEALLDQAVERFLALEESHLRDIEDALLEAEKGDIASSEEVEAVFSRWFNKG